jgi:hypothetical protein
LGGLTAEYDAVKASQRFGGAQEAPQFSNDEDWTEVKDEDKPYKTDMSSGSRRSSTSSRNAIMT